MLKQTTNHTNVSSLCAFSTLFVLVDKAHWKAAYFVCCLAVDNL